MGIVGLSPLRGKDFLKEEAALSHTYDDEILGNQKAITTRDRHDVMNCDLLLASFLGAETVSIGSVMEMAWADMCRKIIVMVMEPDGNIHEHPMLREVAGYRVKTLDEGIFVANAALQMR